MHFLFIDRYFTEFFHKKQFWIIFLFFNAFTGSLPDNIHGSCPGFEEICAFIYLYV